jgi:hypothetical protein
MIIRKILQTIFRRVTVTPAEGIVLDAILSKANLFGKHARVAYECLAGITGFSIRHVMRLVKSLIYERRLLRVDKRVLWPEVLGAQRTLAGHFWDSKKIYERRCFRSAERM